MRNYNEDVQPGPMPNKLLYAGSGRNLSFTDGPGHLVEVAPNGVGVTRLNRVTAPDGSTKAVRPRRRNTSRVHRAGHA